MQTDNDGEQTLEGFSYDADSYLEYRVTGYLAGKNGTQSALSDTEWFGCNTL